MKIEHFNNILKNQLAKCESILSTKEKEYVEGSDRLDQFKKAANLQGISERQALAGMMSKHTTSIYDMCKSEKKYSNEKWDEKITDHINYLILLRAITIEENEIF